MEREPTRMCGAAHCTGSRLSAKFAERLPLTRDIVTIEVASALEQAFLEQQGVAREVGYHALEMPRRPMSDAAATQLL